MSQNGKVRTATPSKRNIKKGFGSMREQLRAMQRSNRRHSGYTALSGEHIRPRDERIKRNHMQTVNFEARMYNAMLGRAYDRAVEQGPFIL